MLGTYFFGHIIETINYSKWFSAWRVNNGWIGIEEEGTLWDIICLSIGIIISSTVSILFYRYTNLRLKPKNQD